MTTTRSAVLSGCSRRFTQPDTIIPRSGDGQSFNRYTYVSNNPINRNDPTGHEDFGDLSGFGQDYMRLAIAVDQNPHQVIYNCSQAAACGSDGLALIADVIVQMNYRSFDTAKHMDRNFDHNISNGDFQAVAGGSNSVMSWAARRLLSAGGFDNYGDNRNWYQKGVVGFAWRHRESILGAIAIAGYLSCGPTGGLGCGIAVAASGLSAASSGQRAYTACSQDLTSASCATNVVATGASLVVTGVGASTTRTITSNVATNSANIPAMSGIYGLNLASATQSVAVNTAVVGEAINLSTDVAGNFYG